MNLLPDELHVGIIAHLPTQDYPNYRLINKRFATIGAEFIFSSFYFDVSAYSIRRMDFIVSNTSEKCLHRHIKNVTYHGDPTLTRADNSSRSFRHEHIVLVTVMEKLVRLGAPIRSLAMHALPCSFFEPETFPASFTRACANMKRVVLHVTSYSWSSRSDTIESFLGSLEHLEALNLDFGPVLDGDYERPGGQDRGHWDGSRPRIRDVLPLHKAWPKIRCLELWYMNTTVDEMVELLRSYAQNLRKLHLAGIDICLDDNNLLCDAEGLKTSWRRLVDEIAAFEKLESVSMGQNRRNPATRDCELVVEGRKGKLVMGTNLERYLVDGEDE